MTSSLRRCVALAAADVAQMAQALVRQRGSAPPLRNVKGGIIVDYSTQTGDRGMLDPRIRPKMTLFGTFS